ncbi:biliverdin-producing heme oxygenase [Empedobacter stercoris]|uniref:biliverdin-producing heme oxygenase n=1 Tax=Empedobacter TaxID=59734 RepID=UPI001D767A30|nr:MULTISPECIES: biliverdin-producing heme oxygenase [Empedobacter]MDM1523925.1 biliverdin-producing heme oxygenase [Empedobacter sp. 225-1]MDM1544172.1 biliverdin-producing heme oxygenase [Empedobacter sp. 189-2]UWX67053.1 biliverdin-producing heme oxygenase [Empedobacter stercoris]HJD86915.1 biliverdin-producing heme oxygenase [Empedobacter falsenii]
MLSDYLKKKTANYHAEIEQKLESHKLFNGTFTDKNYFKMLQVNHVFLKSYEDSIKHLLNDKDIENLALTKLNKLPLIEKDLQELGINELQVNKQFELKNRAEAIGALYVIEGSMLGGNVIAKTLKKYPFLEHKSFNYFGHYGENLGSIWKTFIAYIDQEFTTENEQQQVFEGAKKAYEDLISFA